MGAGHTGATGLGERQTAGSVTSGSDVYYFLKSGPNAGKPRPAVVIRAYQNEERGTDGTKSEAVDLFVFALDEDNLDNDPMILNVPKTPVGIREPGTWDWQEPRESGF